MELTTPQMELTTPRFDPVKYKSTTHDQWQTAAEA